MKNLTADVRTGLRMLGRKPGLSALAVLILALGIGANTAIFSALYSFLLRPLSYPEADRLVQVWNRYPLMDLPKASVSVPDYLDRRSGVRAFEESALFFYQSFNLAAEGPPERVVGLRSTASLFRLLSARTLLGRTFTEEEDQPGRENVVVLSHRLWRRAFGGDPSVVGREIRLNAEAHLVLGVMAEDFAFPHRLVDIWKPFAMTDAQRSDDARGNEFSQMLARLAPGASLHQAQSEIDAIHEANKERLPQAREFWESSGFGGLVIPYRQELFGELVPTLLLLQAAVAMVLLIACANVANLLLTQLSARQRELAVRSVLGASRWRLGRQLLVESLVLGLVAGLVGLGVGYGSMKVLDRLAVEATSGRVEIGLDPGVFLFTVSLSLVVGVVFGVFPVLSLWQARTNAVLREGGTRGGSGGRRSALLRNSLVVAEIALTLVLLVGAGLLLRTLLALQDENPGFKPQQVLTAQVALPQAAYDEAEKITAFFDDALERVRSLPGVDSAAVVSHAPFSGSSSSGSYSVEGYAPPEGESDPHAQIRVIDPEYFRTLEIPLLLGRTFDTFDTAQGEPVVIVDALTVEKYWPDEDPLGKGIRRGGPDSTLFTVVGVVAPIKIAQLDEPIVKETLYFPYAQAPRRGMTFLVRTGQDAEAFAPALRGALRQADPELPTYGLTTLERLLADTLQTERASTVLFLIFGLLAVVLATVGVYGVLSFSVSQRVREVGMRMAVGAQPRQILNLILGQGLVLSLLGIGLGTLLVLGLGRALEALLFGVVPWDPPTLLTVAALLLCVSLLACYGPAHRATRVEPVEALRDE